MNKRKAILATVSALLLTAPAQAQLVLNVNQTSGMIEIVNTSDVDTVNISGYDIRSEQDTGVIDDGLLDPIGWGDLETAIGDSWMATNFPSSEVLLETNPSSVLSLGPGASQSLGNAFSTDSAVIAAAQTSAGYGNEYRDLTFEYIDADSVVPAPVQGAVNYLEEGEILNELVLIVDQATGSLELVNESAVAITIEAYFITSSSGALDPGWNGLSDTVADWEMNIATANALAELSSLDPASDPGAPLNPLTINGGDSFDLGAGFAIVGATDLVFSFLQPSDQSANPGDNGAIRYVMSAIAGDYNGDGMVDAADYTVWRDNLGAAESMLQAPGDGSGVVDAADYLVWRNNYGESLPGSGLVATAASPTPEPMSLISVVLAAATLSGTRLRARQ